MFFFFFLQTKLIGLSLEAKATDGGDIMADLQQVFYWAASDCAVKKS